ncbi:MAG: TonB-dependent receptor [Blastocatellia bacterium]
MKSLMRLMTPLFLLLASSVLVFGQGTTASLSGTVIDPSGAVVTGAAVKVKNMATGAEFQTTTATNGGYTIPSLGAGTYAVVIEARGFKTVAINEVKIDAGTPATVNATLEVGAQSETVTIQSGGEVLQTQSANIATTITGRQITELPFTSRDALDLVLLLPGTSSPGRPRQSSVNGLPKGSLNISMDGVNVQDNVLKSSDGFFTYIRPRIDAIDEVTVSTATPGSESSSEGAVQIKFVTRGGTNEFHGSLYEYHRNPWLNANYWFNNRDLPADPRTGKAPRNRILLNQYGFRLGGPIWLPKIFNGKDKAFFFVNYEEYKLPEQFTRTRTILSPDAEKGIFKYTLSGTTYQVNLLDIAGKTNCAPSGQPTSPCTSTPDPTVAKLLADIRSSTSKGGVAARSDPNYQDFTFTNVGGQSRYFPTVRLDLNATSKHHLENIWNYQYFTGKVDFLNNVDPAFPGFPNEGFQGSNRFSNVTALRSTITQTLVNEARFGITGGTVLFFPNINAGQFANQNGFAIGSSLTAAGFVNAGITNPTVSRSPSRRNAPAKQFNDNVSWSRGAHNLSFGFNFSQINFWSSAYNGGVVPTITFGLDTTDPASAVFTTASNFPTQANGQAAIPSGADLTRAQAIYAALTGRVTTIGATAYVDETGSKYNYLGAYVERARQRELGSYVQDSWKARQNLTVNAGLRWEVQFPFTALNQAYAKTTYAELFGVSGAGNLFKPGTTTGKVTEFTLFKEGDKAFDTSFKNFAPSLGFAWSPNGNGMLKRVLGETGQTVLRGGYSIAFVREGMNVVSSILGANPGGNVDATKSLGNGNLGTLPVLFRNASQLAPPTIPSGPVYPLQGSPSNSANAFLPNIKLGYVQSWTIGVQREISKDTVVEVRYVGNHGVKLWRQYNLNETNIIENGFANEFKLAQANLIANNAAGGTRAGSFGYFGAGTSPLPIMLGYFTGSKDTANAAAYPNTSASLFRNATFVNALFPNAPDALGFANNMIGNLARRQNAGAAGFAANQFVVNPGKFGGAFLVDNGNWSKFNALTVELRRRLSHGLLVQGSYSFSKGLTNYFASSSAVAKNYVSMRNLNLDNTVSPFDIRHGLKMNWIYELPIGKGKALFGNMNKATDLALGGWEFHGAARLQSGSSFNFGNVQLVGMTRKDLQNAVKIRQDDAGKKTFFLPQDIVDNTIKAFSFTGSGYSSGAPSGRYIAPASDATCLQTYTGQCGFSNVVLYGPKFTKFDLSAVKKIRFTERFNFELRAEFLDAFNNINFMVGSPANDVNSITNFNNAAFGQTRNAYQDTSTTNDPGGRLVQIVARINF